MTQRGYGVSHFLNIQYVYEIVMFEMYHLRDILKNVDN